MHARNIGVHGKVSEFTLECKFCNPQQGSEISVQLLKIRTTELLHKSDLNNLGRQFGRSI